MSTLAIVTTVVSVPVLTTYIAPFISVLVALLAKATAPTWLKAILNLLLSAVLAEVTVAIANDGLVLDDKFLLAFGWSFALSIAAYYGLWKPTKVAGSDGVVAKAIPAGIG